MGRAARIRKKNRRSKEGGVLRIGNDSVLIKLITWLKSFGWSPTSSLHPAVFPDTGRGLMADKNILINDILVRIPLSALITTATVEESDICQTLSHKTLLAQEILAAFLIWEKRKGDKSKWAPYIDSLPTDFTTALYLSSSQIPTLPGFLRKTSIDAKESADRSLYRLQQLLPDIQEAEFHWAWSCVNTRAVYLPQKTLKKNSNQLQIADQDCMALAPYLDLFNHSNVASVNINVTAAGYELSTNVPYKKYDQVFINYGPHSNLKLFAEYGFIVPVNPNDTVPLSTTDLLNAAEITQSSGKTRVEAKMNFLKAQGLLNSAALNRSGATWSAIAVIRLLKSASSNPNRWSSEVYFREDDDKVDRSMSRNLVRISQDYGRSLEKACEIFAKNIANDSEKYSASHACIYLMKELKSVVCLAGEALLKEVDL